MTVVITCPVDKSEICEYVFDMSISDAVDEHMAKEHPNWYKVIGLIWLPKDAPHCPICDVPFKDLNGLDRHVRTMHTDYVKVDIMDYRLRKDPDV